MKPWPSLTSLRCSWANLVIRTIVHAPDIVSFRSMLRSESLFMMHQDSDKLTAEVEDQIRDADRPVERVVQLALCNRPIARLGRRAYSPYPKHCIVVV